MQIRASEIFIIIMSFHLFLIFVLVKFSQKRRHFVLPSEFIQVKMKPLILQN